MFKRNTIIARKNKGAFKDTPVIRVNSCYKVQSGCNKGHCKINDKYLIKPDSVEVISEPEADKLIALWNSLNISETVIGQHSHFRSDNGEAKVSLDIDECRGILFHYINRHDGGFDINNLPYQIYVCPECNGLHLGKTSNIHAST